MKNCSDLDGDPAHSAGKVDGASTDMMVARMVS